MSKHTQEPWSLSSSKNAAGVITGGQARELHTGASVQGQIASACLQEWMAIGEREANARRIVACVNACRGLPTDELEQKGLVAAVGAELLELEQQLDYLLAEKEDHQRLVRDLDVLLNGVDGAAHQASLCDLVAQLKSKGGAA